MVMDETPACLPSGDPPLGQVGPICTEALELAKGKRVEIADLGPEYAARCRARGWRPYPPEEFGAQLETFCARTGIRIKRIGSKVFLLDVQLVSSEEPTGSTGSQRLGPMGRRLNS
jgi:hypothetical protein